MRCGCLRWVEQRFCWCKSKVLVERICAGLAAVAFRAVALIRELAWMDFLTLRSLLWVVTGRRLSLTACRSGRSGCIRCRDVDADAKSHQSADFLLPSAITLNPLVGSG